MKKLLLFLLVIISVSTFAQNRRIFKHPCLPVVLSSVVVKKEIVAQVREMNCDTVVWVLAFRNQKYNIAEDYRYLPIKYDKRGAGILRDLWLSAMKENDQFTVNYMFGGQFIQFQVVDTKARKEVGLIWKDSYVFLSEDEVNELFKFLKP